MRMKLTGHPSFGLNDSCTHTDRKSLEDAVAVWPSATTIEAPKEDDSRIKK